MRNRTGPSQALSLLGDPARRSGGISSGVVRISVTLAIVAVEAAAAIALRHGLGRPEVDHVERAAPSRHRAAACGRSRRAGPGRRGSTPPNRRSQTSVVVTSMTPASRPLSASFSIAAAAGAGGVEDQAVVVVRSALDDLRHARRGDAEHGEADAPACRRPPAPACARHAGDGVGGIAQHDAADAG